MVIVWFISACFLGEGSSDGPGLPVPLSRSPVGTSYLQLRNSFRSDAPIRASRRAQSQHPE